MTNAAVNHGFYYKLDTDNKLILDYALIDIIVLCVSESEGKYLYENIDTSALLEFNFYFDHSNTDSTKYFLFYQCDYAPTNAMTKTLDIYNLRYPEPRMVQSFDTNNKKIGVIDKTDINNSFFVYWKGFITMRLTNNDPNAKWPKIEDKIGPMPT